MLCIAERDPYGSSSEMIISVSSQDNDYDNDDNNVTLSAFDVNKE